MERLSACDGERWAELRGRQEVAEVSLQAARAVLVYFQKYLSEKYNLEDGDQVTPELEIVRKPETPKPEPSPNVSQLIVP